VTRNAEFAARNAETRTGGNRNVLLGVADRHLREPVWATLVTALWLRGGMGSVMVTACTSGLVGGRCQFLSSTASSSGGENTMASRKIAATLALLTALIVAAVPAGAAERFHTSTLQWVYPLASGDFVIGFDADSSYCSGTNTPKYMCVVVGQNGVTAEGAKKMFAAALTSLALGKTLGIAFDDGTSYCCVNRVSVNK
jgi:hypothetical protein